MTRWRLGGRQKAVCALIRNCITVMHFILWGIKAGLWMSNRTEPNRTTHRDAMKRVLNCVSVGLDSCWTGKWLSLTCQLLSTRCSLAHGRNHDPNGR